MKRAPDTARSEVKMRIRRAFESCILILLFALAAAGQERPLILISNDDGIDSGGLKALALELSGLGEVVVVAPLRNSSGVGHGITYKVPISYGRSEAIPGVEAWWIDALPATCVRWGIDTRLGGRSPDLVVSGINVGSNLGEAVYYSGTLAVAREGALCGCTAIAVSMNNSTDADYAGAARRVRDIAERVLSAENRPLLLNVNVPAGKITAETELCVTFLTRARWTVLYHDRVSPRGGNYFWITFEEGGEYEPGSDAEALSRGAITVTPLLIDSSYMENIDSLRDLLSR
jgi:5'-nucleotidase